MSLPESPLSHALPKSTTSGAFKRGKQQRNAEPNKRVEYLIVYRHTRGALSYNLLFPHLISCHTAPRTKPKLKPKQPWMTNMPQLQ